MNRDLQVFEQTAFTPEETARMGLKVLAEYLKAGTEALQKISLLASEQDARLKRLEKQMALEKRMTQGQASNIWRAMRERACILCEKNGLPTMAGGRMSAARKLIQKHIRQELYKRFGVSKVDAIPQVEYRAAIELIDSWMNVGAIQRAGQEQSKQDGGAQK
jgi:hypothetical protein